MSSTNKLNKTFILYLNSLIGQIQIFFFSFIVGCREKGAFVGGQSVCSASLLYILHYNILISMRDFPPILIEIQLSLSI